MLYIDENGNLLTRIAAINKITEQLGTAVINPSYFDDVTLSLFGIKPVEQQPVQQTINTSEKKEALGAVDWVTNAEHITKECKEKVEAWRWLVRNLPKGANIPPLPQLCQKLNYVTKPELTEKECELIKNYRTADNGWLTFLQIWKDWGFTAHKQTIIKLLSAYTNVKLDEIIRSI